MSSTPKRDPKLNEVAEEWEDIVEERLTEQAGLVNFKANDGTGVALAASDSNSTGSNDLRSGSSRTLTNRSSPRRRRKPGPRIVFVTANPSKTYNIPPSLSPRTHADSSARPSPQLIPPDTQPIVTAKELQTAATHGVRFTISYAVDVLFRALRWLKYPLSLFLVLYLIALILSQVSSAIHTVFRPLCIIPGISSTYLCKHPKLETKFPRPDYSQMVALQSKTFEQLMDQSVRGAGLSLEVKKAEMATSDLITLVGMSNLKSKDILAETLRDFVTDAKATARGLNRLNAKVMGAVDDIVAVNDYALRTIEAASQSKPLVSYLWPSSFSSSQAQQHMISTSFGQSMSVLSAALGRCVLEATLSMHALDSLDQRLQTLHSIIAREDASLTSAQSDLLAHLWTILGGNRKELKSFEDHLQLLKNVGEYRTRARAHVAGAMHTLDEMEAQIEEMRTKAGGVGLIGGDVPLEVHIKSIQSGLARLTEGRRRAKVKESEVVRSILGTHAHELEG